jgi:pimeloyl-ACP methyl ester carboxylesterase
VRQSLQRVRGRLPRYVAAVGSKRPKRSCAPLAAKISRRGPDAGAMQLWSFNSVFLYWGEQFLEEAEQLKPCYRWTMRVGAGIAAFFALAAGGGMFYERFAQYRAVRDFPPPGKMVDVGGRRIQLNCEGGGSPTVVFESGLSIEGSLTWSDVQPQVAKRTRACSYSRAGLMWSDASTARADINRVAHDLHAALTDGGEDGPLVLVGHSLGGPYVMGYTKYFGDEVAGLVLVDASHPDQLRRVAGVMTEARSALSRAAVSLAWTGALRAIMPAMLPSGSHHTRRDAQAIQAYAAKSFATLFEENEAIDSTLEEAGTFRDLGERPLVVLTAMAPFTEPELRAMKITQVQGTQVKGIWRELQQDEASWSSRSHHVLLPHSGHNIQREDPGAVIEAVLSVVDAVRGSTAAKRWSQ